ncbi:hypothetical protein K437DRAFT_267771 [Tilletiaria anomala UBC 951]|uniref:Uncharacterized protein n=1 Tax=Tilletiaria anomala (strain ATCC 24038 / CBS 436.72 / UBC 951) TaxID=1037660 RepID=A0A066W182_TILAU|nr:uncharacterized protein K437DRAFT_267771 [Tilletiaria anomala UBC 951]KDN47727.1 hypothetical protein K437DRAFT_267771 [Tilletiaria anomala UBC 951]
MSTSSLPLASLKHITSLTFSLSPLVSSPGARSVRLLLSRIPSSLPPPKKAAEIGLAKLPEVSVNMVQKEEEVGVHVVYSDKKSQEIRPGVESQMGVAELIRKVEAPARALRLKEQGI